MNNFIYLKRRLLKVVLDKRIHWIKNQREAKKLINQFIKS